MRWIIQWSLKFRLVVLAVAAATMAIGIGQLRSAPVDVLPEFTPPYVEIQTEALGLSADEVEQLITVPLEADLLNGVQGVEVIRSQSLPGLSSIVLVFEPGTDVYRGRQLVQERLTQLGAAALPMISKPSTVLPPLSSSSRVLMIGLSSQDLSLIEQSVIARWTIRPRLMGVPGVANVAVWGMRDQQLQVQVDPERLRDQHVTLSQVVETAGNAQVFSPLSYLEASTPGTGGFIETGQQRLQVRNVLETIADPAALGEVPVDGTGSRLRLADVADIRIDHQPLIGNAIVNDGEGLLLVVEKYPGADTLQVTEGVEEALDKLRPGLADLRTDTSVFRPANFVDEAIDNLALTFAIAGALLLLVIAAFLFQWRAVLIGVVTIPLSLVVAALVLDLLGETFNAISFAGLAAALALVVDEAVVSVDGVAERLRRRRAAGGGQSTASTLLEASHAVRSPLVYATLVALLAVVPVAVMQGRPGAFFGPLALSYAVAVVAAMAVALTVTPALSMLLLARGVPGGESPLSRRVGPGYDRALSGFVRRPRVALVAAVVCVAAGLAVLPFLETSPVPSFKDRHAIVRLAGDPGISSVRMTELATAVSRDLRSIPGVESVAAHVGRAVTGDQLVDVNSGEVWVGIEPDADYAATMASIDAAVGRVRGASHEVVTYSTQRIRDVGGLADGQNPVRGDNLDVLTGAGEPIVVRVYGQNPDVLLREAEKVRRVMSGVDGVVAPRVVRPATQPSLEIEVDLAKARSHGIKPGDVRRAETTLLQGILVGSVFQRQKVFDVVVQGVPETRASEAAVRNLLIDTPDGGHVRLGDVADVRESRAPTVITRDAVSRRVDVVAGVSGRNVGSVAGDIENRLAGLSLPLEYHAQVLQRTTDAEMGATRVLAVAITVAIGMFLLLQAAFQSWRLAGLAFAGLPVALAGGLLAVLIDGGGLSLGSLIGLLAVFGLAARTSVLLIRRFQELERDDGEELGLPLVQVGARERLVPITTTAAALAAGALPFVVLGGRPGLEVVSPMAVVMLGGLVSSTFLSLFVLPALYLRFGAGGRPMQPLRYALERMRRRGRLEAEPVVAGAGGNGGTDVKAGADSPESSSNGGIDDGERGTGAHEPVV